MFTSLLLLRIKLRFDERSLNYLVTINYLSEWHLPLNISFNDWHLHFYKVGATSWTTPFANSNPA